MNITALIAAFTMLASSNPTPPGARVESVHTSGIPQELRTRLVTYRANDLWQTVYWAFAFTDQKSLKIELFYPNTIAKEEFSYSASFAIQYVRSQKYDVARKKSTLIVAGVTDSGFPIIERWVHKPSKNQIPNTPLVYQLSRSVVFTGTTPGTIDAIEVEPFGEYVVVACTDPTPHLVQIDLSPGNIVTPLLDPVHEALLTSGIRRIRRAEHETEGLLWVLYLRLPAFGGGDWAMILRDMDNDDVLDDWMGYPYAQMSAFYPSQFSSSPWVDDFVTYR